MTGWLSEKGYVGRWNDKFEGWRKAVQKAGRWFRRVEEGAELSMLKWHEKEGRKAAEPRAMAVAPLSTVGISILSGGGGRGKGVKGARHAQATEVWVWPSSSCKLWASNGRHKIA